MRSLLQGVDARSAIFGAALAVVGGVAVLIFSEVFIRMREKKHARIDVLAPVWDGVLRDLDNPSWPVHRPEGAELVRCELHMGWYRRRQLRKAVAALERAHEEQERCGPAGDRSYADTGPIQHALRRLEKAVRPK